MNLSSLYILSVISILGAVGYYLSFSDGSHPDKRDIGATILAIIVIILMITILISKKSYSPIQDPKFIKKGLVATVVPQPTDTFFIKTPSGQIFLIRPDKKGKKIPVAGDKVVFTGDSYEIISDK